MADTRIVLNESEIPRQWYNIAADLPNPPAPPAAPGHACSRSDPADLAPLFPMELIKQEVSAGALDRHPG